MSDSSSFSPPVTPPSAMQPILHQNPVDPSAPWLVQKYGGTSVGKFASKICEEIIPMHLDQHRVVIVCSARSGTNKTLGTTNLLLRAAGEALNRGPCVPRVVSGTLGSSIKTPRSDSPPSVDSPGLWPTSSPIDTPSYPLSLTPPATSDQKDKDTSVPHAFPFPSFYATIDTLRGEHIAAAQENIRDPALLGELKDEIERDCDALRGFLSAAQVIDEISPRSKDSIVGFGEKLACKLMTTILRDRGIDSEFVSLENIVSSEGDFTLFDEGGHLDQSFYNELSVLFSERIKQCGPRVPVVTGFFGPVPGSLLKQIGRGYTDLAAALLAAGLGACELQVWKEVDGIFTADPRKVPTARLIPIISPEEAAELTYYGSEVVHPFTMEQVIRRDIPIRIKNVENPRGGGTIIHPDPDESFENMSRPVCGTITPEEISSSRAHSLSLPNSTKHRRLPTAVTIKENIVVISVNSNRRTKSHGFLAKIFGTLDKFGVVVDLISTSEVHISMAIEDSLDKRFFDRLLRELKKIGSVSVHGDMAILSLVGKKMRHMVGISGRMFTALADGNINIEMISQGASEINISCVIDGRDAIKALNLIHQTCLQIKPEGARGIIGQWLF